MHQVYSIRRGRTSDHFGQSDFPPQYIDLRPIAIGMQSISSDNDRSIVPTTPEEILASSGGEDLLSKAIRRLTHYGSPLPCTSLGIFDSEEKAYNFKKLITSHYHPRSTNPKRSYTSTNTPVTMYDFEGEHLATFPSIITATQDAGVSYESVSQCLSGKISSTFSCNGHGQVTFRRLAGASLPPKFQRRRCAASCVLRTDPDGILVERFRSADAASWDGQDEPLEIERIIEHGTSFALAPNRESSFNYTVIFPPRSPKEFAIDLQTEMVFP